MTEIKFNVLIAEDEENIGNFISAILKTNGYKPIIATTGNQAIQCAESYCPDVILLDLGLPDMDGIDVISEIRKWAVTPIIVISARNRESEKVKALDAGADDYITKPFGNQELLARIRTALRHRRQPMGAETKTPMYHAGQLKIDFDKRRVFLGEEEIRLTQIEYKLVSLLAENAGKVITYEIIHNNDVRDEQIIEDVKNCVSAGRTPVVLSRYKDHSEKLYERLKSYADHVFLMTGNNSKKEQRKILKLMHEVKNDESMILVATGSLVGEGFDFPRLDTLFMATPISFRGVVEQYAGRLNRDYAGKENVIIYDYVDNHIPMFDNMYMKRLKAYKQIGYELSSGLKADKQIVNAIYGGDNYRETFHKDLLDANKNIIISSPAISGQKVYELISMLKEKQEAGVQITIVTWMPDSYGFGDAAYWMQLHEDMRKAGFYIKTVEEYCDRFAVIDQEVVWYGNINLLAKDKIDNSIMRVMSKDIAGELMEITFGDNDREVRCNVND